MGLHAGGAGASRGGLRRIAARATMLRRRFPAFTLTTYSQGRVQFPTGGNPWRYRGEPASARRRTGSADPVRGRSRR